MKPPKKRTWVVLGLVLVLILTAVLAWMTAPQPGWDQRLYRIGYENAPPLLFQGEDGKPTGLSVDVVAEAARRRGIRLHWVFAPESSVAALKSGKVDLWPALALLPERQGVVYVTDPYRDIEASLLVRDESTFARPQDLRNATVGYRGLPLEVTLLRSLLPDAQLVAIRSSKERLEAVCRRRVDASYFDEYAAVATLLAGVSCGGLRVIRLPELRTRLGVGATFQAKGVADAIRKELGAMAADGSLATIASRWGYFSGRNLEMVDALLRAERTQRWLIGGTAAAVLVLLLTLWQALRIRHERDSARRAREALRESADQLRELAAHLQDAREEERTRIARELHDELGQGLTIIKLQVSELVRAVPREEKALAERLQSTIGLVDAAIDDVRRVATELRPAELDFGLDSAIRWQVQEFQAHTRMDCIAELSIENPAWDADRSTTLFRILQEALTNVARHSRATRVEVRLTRSDGHIVLEVKDNGRGITEDQSGGRTGSLGILGMRERALAVGGKLTVASRAGGGTVVRARIPID